jgi:hypothetical protein
MLPIVWVTCGVMVVAAAVRSRRSQQAVRFGRLALAALFVVAGALVNAIMLAGGEDYADFADGAYLAFVRDTWRDVVVPNHHAWISLLIGFEAAVGLLAVVGGRSAQLALVAAIAFHVALLSFGWGFYLWSIPMIGAFSLLLRAERRQSSRAAMATLAPVSDLQEAA